MACAMEPQRKGMAVGSGGFQACPNLWNVVLFEDAGQLSKALGIILKAKAHCLPPAVRSSACTLFLATSKPSTGSESVDKQMEFIFSFHFLVFWLLAALCSHLAFREQSGIGDKLVCALFVG